MLGRLVLLLLLLSVLFTRPQVAYLEQEQNVIRSVKVKEVPFKDVRSSIWKKAPVSRVNVIPQNITLPFLQTPSIKEISVRSVHNGEWIAFLLEWEDETRDAAVDVDKFTDQVAIQIPLTPKNLPAFMMGNKGGRVHIIHWKAIWQDDIEKGYRDVQVLHPNYWVDLYFFSDKPPIYAEGEFPLQPTTVDYFITPEALNFIPGAYARNPISMLHRTQPVEEAIAEGFGTFTTQPKQNAIGWGKWGNGLWKVIIARPLITDDPNDASISEKTFTAFAVWNGSAKNVGARKHYAPWIGLVVEK
ncbi:MAG: hypothetical protein HY693_01635 [Deltaproteobacteria bacterium]|nr:hypothetical protein [Deltaproteobacteria bacterium]